MAEIDQERNTSQSTKPDLQKTIPEIQDAIQRLRVRLDRDAIAIFKMKIAINKIAWLKIHGPSCDKKCGEGCPTWLAQKVLEDVW